MYETGCSDPNPVTEGAELPEDGVFQTAPNCSHNTQSSFEENLRFSMEELSYHLNHANPPTHEGTAAAATATGTELQQQLAFSGDNATNHNNTHLVDNSYSGHEMRDVDALNHHHHHHHHLEDQQLLLQQIDVQNGHQSFHYPSLPYSPYPFTPDLLNLFHLPRCSASSLLPSSSISFTNHQHPLGFLGDVSTGSDHGSSASVLHEPLFHLNQPPQSPLFRELFQSLPNCYSLPGSRNCSLFGTGGDTGEESGDVRQSENGLLEFTRDMACAGKAEDGETKHFPTERQRRQHLNDKYKALGSLVPNPTKTDKASVVSDAIEYIKELLGTVHELKLLVEKKRCGRERIKRHKVEVDDADGDVESCNMKPLGDTDRSYSGLLRSSWLQRKSRETEVDVRIVNDEVTIKLVQRKNNCLLLASKVLDELQLDLHHVAGGHIGHFYSFLFNTKICEGSSVYANSIANRLIEVVDGQCAAFPPTNCL